MTIWRVRLFDGPVLESASGEETFRFRSVKVQGLLALLALRLGRRCSREEIGDALWPEELDSAVVANRLRVTLASLRRQLEPPGIDFGTVLDASVPGCLRLRNETVWCDVAAFDRAMAEGDVEEAARLASGRLLPGLYDEWVRSEQVRLDVLRDELSESGHRHVPDRSAPNLSLPDHRLPLYLTRFVGRQREIEDLERQLRENRLVTLTGPGGIGKSRLAVEAAQNLKWPAVFVPLAALAEPSALADAILKALGIATRNADDPLGQLVETLRDRPTLLLILDSAEEFVEAVADTGFRLLEESPQLRLLVTSRQRLEVTGEAVVDVPALECPPMDVEFDRLPAYASIALFIDRARSVVPDFILLPHHLEPLTDLCQRLGGIPLAIELAAMRVSVQSPAQIAAALAANLLDLKSRQRGLSERHRSLRAAIQGSYEMLPEEVRWVFVQLSIFRGGWTAEAARAVCEEPNIEEMLTELVFRSLVRAHEDEASQRIRYSFLEPLRAFAAEPLSDKAAEVCRDRHAEYFLGLASAVDEDDIRTFTALDVEEENLQDALNWIRSRDFDKYVRGISGALIHAFIRGHHRRAARWIEESASLIGSIADPSLEFRWRYAACLILPDIGRLDETEQIAEAMSGEGGETALYAQVIRAYVLEARGAIAEARALGEATLEAAREAANPHLLATSLSHTSGTLHMFGTYFGADTEEGRRALTLAEALARELRSIVPVRSRRNALASLLVAAALWHQRRLPEAYEFFKETEATAVRLGTTTELMFAFLSEASIAAEWGWLDHAALLYGAFLALQERMGYSFRQSESPRAAWVTSLEEKLAEWSDAPALLERGRSASPAELALLRVSAPD